MKSLDVSGQVSRKESPIRQEVSSGILKSEVSESFRFTTVKIMDIKDILAVKLRFQKQVAEVIILCEELL